MPAARARFAVLALVFLAWLGWLGYMAWKTADPVVLPRPQLTLATVVVEANVSPDPAAKAFRAEVIKVYKGAEILAPLKGQGPLLVYQLDQASGWTGPG